MKIYFFSKNYLPKLEINQTKNTLYYTSPYELSHVPHDLNYDTPNINFNEQQSLPLLSSSFTSNSYHQHHNPKVSKYGSTASSLNILSSSSSSFSSFSSNVSGDSLFLKQQQQQKLLPQNSSQHFLACRPGSKSIEPPSSLAIHRSSLPVAFNTSKTPTDNILTNQFGTSSFDDDLAAVDIYHHNANSNTNEIMLGKFENESAAPPPPVIYMFIILITNDV